MQPRALNQLVVELEPEDDGRWIGEVIAIPGALAYGQTPEDAAVKVKALARRILADKLEHGEDVPEIQAFFTTAVAA
jgi:predicted RNase H-like HicB family nuclease